MAYASLRSITQTLEQILHPDDKCRDLRQTEKQLMSSLHRKVSFLLSYLEDSSLKNSETIRSTEERIRDLAYEAEDIIDSHIDIPNQIVSESRNHGIINCFWEIISVIQNLMPAIGNYMLEKKYKGLQKVIRELDSISEEVMKMKDRNNVEDLPPNYFLPAASSQSGSDNKTNMVGFENDLLQIKDRLTGKTSKLEIIPIVGMGGIGKTTLAKNVYDDSLIVYHFDTRAWITVSQNYHLRGMLHGLLDSSGHIIDELSQQSTEDLATALYKSLKGSRRYLIVIDDLWDTKAWDEVKRLFPDDNNGSRIILTTRLSDVAVYVNSFSPIHHLRLQSRKESWNILREKVFGKESCPLELEEIGMDIAENCKGLPLTLAVIGGLLYKTKRTRDYWQYIARNVNSAITETGDQFMEILSLSYKYLPHHLKACFLYMGVFPEDHEITVAKLIKLWVAEGFLKPDKSKNLEEVAMDYLEHLIDRNLILVYKRSSAGIIKTCIVHDSMRELCLKKAQEENFLQVMDRSVVSFQAGARNQRHISIHSDIHDYVAGIYGSPVRSLLFFCSTTWSQSLSSTFSFLLLRVFDAFTLRFYEFPVQIVELVNLRYIALSFHFKVNEISFPASISKLCNLQTLIVDRYYWCISYLPMDMWKMPRLRHLVFKSCFLPNPSDALNGIVYENLQTLEGIRNFRCTKEVLQMMPNLKKLKLLYDFDGETRWSSYCIDNIVHLQQLENFSCFFIGESNRVNRAPLPENIAFPAKLKNLKLSGCRISWKNMMIIGSLLNLEALKLEDFSFEGPVWEPNEGDFLRLKLLLLSGTDLAHWRANKEHFPSLQRLSLMSCSELVEIPSGIGEIPTLQVIKLVDCGPSVMSSAELIQEEQQSFGNYGLQIILRSVLQENIRTSILAYKAALRYIELTAIEGAASGTGSAEDAES